jgi:hypothetical protein
MMWSVYYLCAGAEQKGAKEFEGGLAAERRPILPLV